MKVLGIITTDENATKSDDNISTAPGGERQQPVPGQRSRCQARKVGGKVCGAMPSTVAQIVDLIRSKSEAGCTLAVERSQPMPKQGVTSVFTYGQHYGILEAIAACLMMAYTSIRPVEWKKAMGLNSDKTCSIIEAERLFPSVELIPPRCRKPSDGIAEALLIAEYTRRKLKEI